MTKTILLFLGFVLSALLAFWSVWLTVLGFGVTVVLAFVWRPS